MRSSRLHWNRQCERHTATLVRMALQHVFQARRRVPVLPSSMMAPTIDRLETAEEVVRRCLLPLADAIRVPVQIRLTPLDVPRDASPHLGLESRHGYRGLAQDIQAMRVTARVTALRKHHDVPLVLRVLRELVELQNMMRFHLAFRRTPPAVLAHVPTSDANPPAEAAH